MAGERSAYFIEMAERGAQRLTERLAMIADRYGAPDDQTMKPEDWAQHERDYGHAYDDACTAPHCAKWRAMVEGAMAQMQRGA